MYLSNYIPKMRLPRNSSLLNPLWYQVLHHNGAPQRGSSVVFPRVCFGGGEVNRWKEVLIQATLISACGGGGVFLSSGPFAGSSCWQLANSFLSLTSGGGVGPSSTSLLWLRGPRRFSRSAFYPSFAASSTSTNERHTVFCHGECASVFLVQTFRKKNFGFNF